jgi:hypothetical protein
MRALTRVGVLVAIILAASACGGGHRTETAAAPSGSRARVSTRTISSSRLILGGRVRCTATVNTPVQAGQELRLRFAFHNVSHRALKVGLAPWDVSFVLRAGDGTRFDSRALVSPTIPYVPATDLAAGATRTLTRAGSVARVRWKGPLRITPACEQFRLPVLRMAVTAPGPPPDDRTAVADVVTASGDVLDHCRPQQAGVAVQGQLVAPGGSAPPMDAACSVSIHREGGFLVAQTLIVLPPGLRGVHVGQYEQLSLPKRGRSLEAIAWEFVVTKAGATPVATATQDRSKPGARMSPDWTWQGSGWHRTGDSRCGGEFITGGAFADPTAEFISVCPS